MQINNIKRNTKRKISRQVGRGGKRGKTSGKGHKGQKARAGHKIRPEMRDVIKKLPKLRGRGVNSLKSIKVSHGSVNLSKLEELFNNNDVISPKTLFEKNLIKKVSGKFPPVKILGGGEISKKLSFEKCAVTKSAVEKINKAGGTIKA